MADDSKKPRSTKGAPVPVEFSPPTAKKRTDDSSKRNLPKPEPSGLPPLSPKPGTGRVDRSNASGSPRLGKGAYARKKRLRIRYSPTPEVKRVLGVIVTLAVLVVLTVMLFNRLINPNAFAVYMDNRFMGYVHIDNYTTSESFHHDVIAHIESNRARTNIVTSSEITIREARFARNVMDRRTVIDRIGRYMQYQIMARGIYVDGRFEALVRNESYVNEIVRLLVEPWYNTNTDSYRILTPWRVEEILVDVDDDRLITPVDAYSHLSRRVWRYITHTVQDGEMLGSIAILYNTSANAIATANNITLDTIIRPGMELRVSYRMPLVSIETIDLITNTEVIPIRVAEQPTPYLPTTHNVLISNGREGAQDVSLRRVFVDGRLISEEELAAVITLPMVEEVREVGTLPITGVEIR